MLDGVLVFNKPREFTSHDVVAKLRGILKTRKIGHAGTLDPMAEGVLVILIGRATKASDYLAAEQKTYRAGIRFGMVSDTLDIWGEVEHTGAEPPDEAAVKAAVDSFRGGYTQLPPMYSAIQKDGVRLYDLARQGVVVERESRWVDIDYIELLGYQNGVAEIEVTCSKGTYIRTLCHDIGEKLGCGAVMDSLTRLSSGTFDIADAYDFDEVTQMMSDGGLSDVIKPMEAIFAHLPQLRANDEGVKRALNGAYVAQSMLVDGKIPEEEGVLCALNTSDGKIVTLVKSGRLATSKQPALFYEKTFYIGER